MNREIAELREVITKLVPLLTGKGLTVTQRGTQAYVEACPRTNKPLRVNIPSIPDNASSDFIAAVAGFIDHEVAHVLFTNWKVYGGDGKKLSKFSPEGQALMNMHNIIEDTMIERRIIETFPGSVYNLDKLHRHFVDKITTPAVTNARSDEEKFAYIIVPMMRALSGQDIFQEFMDKNNHWAHPMVDNLLKAMSDDALDLIKVARSTEETLEVAQEIHDILFMQKQREEEERQKQAQQKAQKQQGKKGSSDKPEKEAEAGEGTGERDHSKKQEEEGAGQAGGNAEGEAEKSEDENEGGKGKGKSKPKAEEEKAEEEEGEQSHGAGGAEEEEKAEEKQEEEGAGEPANEGDDEPADEEAGSEPGQGDDDGKEEDGEQGSAGEGDEDEEDGEQQSSGAGDDEGEDDGSEVGNGIGEKEEEVEHRGNEEGGSDEQMGSSEPLDHDGAGGESGKSMFDLDPSQFTPLDLSSAMAKEIESLATVSVASSDYSVFTKDEDRIETFNVPDQQMRDEWVPQMDERVMSLIGPMQKEIERMMAAQTFAVRTPGHRSGRLHAPSLYKVMQGDSRVFQRKEEHKAKDTAVMLLVDNSGSMHGAKMATAMQAAYALAMTLERVNIANEVVGFTTGNLSRSAIQQMQTERLKGVNFNRNATIVMPVYKNFNERVTPTVKRRIAFQVNMQTGLNNNIDGESLEYAALRLLPRREKRKVMLVLSDGQPVGSNAPWHLKHTVERLTKMGVETVGIGINSNAVQNYYPRSLVLNNVADLPAAVMGELRRILTK